MAFGSFDSKPGAPTMSEINMVPLIDVMLVLLVIFMITAPLLTHSIKINIPQASAQAAAAEAATIDLAVDGQGRMYWNDESMDPDTLQERLAQAAASDPQPELRLRADRDTRYETLARIMGEAKSSGIAKMGFVTRPHGPSGGSGGAD